ncbi:putative ribonuclease H-like domain-containing protein [Tanacetum coccineum]
MDLETTQTNTTAKLPILKQGEYDMWKLRIEQYFQVQDYALWDVIENGNSFKPAAQTTTNAEGTSTTLIPGPVTADEKVQKKNDVKARSMLLMALLNEHLLTFNQYKDAKTLFAAIQTRFGGFRRLNKPDLDAMSFDDLYNNFKIIEQQVKGTASSSSQNMAFVSSPSSTNEVNTTYEVSTATTQVSPASTQVTTASTQVSTANLSDAIVYAFLANQPNGSQLVLEDLEQIHEDDLEELDLKWRDKVPTNMALMAFLDSEVHNDKTCSKTCLKSFETLKTQLDDLRIEFNKSEFNLATYKRGLASVEEQLVFYKKNEVIFCEQLVVLKRYISYKDSKISMLKSELEKLKQEKESNQLKIENFNNASKSLDKLIGSQITNNSRKGVGFVSYNVVPPPYTGLFSPPKLDLSNSGLEEFQQPEFEGYGPKTSKSVSEDISNKVRESLDAPFVEELVSNDKLEKKIVFLTVAKVEFVRPKQQEKPVRKPVKYGEMYRLTAITIKGKGWNMAPRAVLMKTGLRPLNTARPVNTAHPKIIVYSARPMSFNTAKERFYSAMPKAVNTARPNSAVVNVVRANQVNVVKASACWVWRPTKLNSASITLKRHNYVDARGRSKSVMGTCPISQTLRNLMEDMLPLGEEPKEGKLLVKELLKLMCDKKNSVLFTDTGCFVLSPDFKLADESQVLLKVPRKNNMYSVDIKNIVPKECLTCLVAKATLDESMLWHRRLDYLVFFLASKDKTSGILNSFITEIENLVDKKVKIIRCDNGTGFKNRVMSEFYEKKGIKREFSCRLDSKLKQLILLAMCRIWLLGYTTLELMEKVEENLHIRFLEDKPIIAGDGPKWLFDIDVLTKLMNYVPVVAGTNSNDSVGTEESVGTGHSSKETGSSQDYILMPLWKDVSLFDSSSKNASNDEPQPSSDSRKKVDEGGIDDQERPENSTQDVNTVGLSINTASTNFNTGSLNINIVSPTVTPAPLETTHADFFDDETDWI